MKRTFWMMVCFWAAVWVGGCSTSWQSQPGAAASAQVPDRKGELLTSIAARYENPQAHYELGKIYHQEGRYDRAEFHYNVAISFDPVHRQAQAALVKLYQDRKDPQRARITAETYINQAATSAASLMALGRGFQREKLDDYALTCYKRAAELEPTSASIHKQLGYFYLSKGDTVLAENHLRRSFELDPNQPDVAAELGRMGVRVQIPARKSTGLLGPLRGAEPDETIK
ncbi:MAG: tetratricopeptide repeat protein [Planctomycetes bacterium]|jgi:Flp pilus assembly protein TadD|nr:tetratricopeptide repeat protein [Planctomycetota bacterium]